MITFTIPLKPMTSPRRVVYNGRSFMPSSYMKWKKDAGWFIPKAALDCVISVFIECVVSMPKSHSKKQRAEALGGLKLPLGDVDNYGKSVLDAMVDYGLIKDDRLVSGLWVSKRYGDADCVNVRVELGVVNLPAYSVSTSPRS